MKKKTQDKELFFDIVSVSFSNIDTDGRTFNLLNTLSSFGKKICVICFSEIPSPHFFQDNIYILPVPIKIFNNKRLTSYNKLLKFNKYVTNTYLNRSFSLPHTLKISSAFQIRKQKPKFIVANDLYGLPIARNISKLLKTQLIYDSREVYSALGSLSNRPLKQKVLSYLEKFLVLSVNKIITSGKKDTDYLKNVHFVSKKFSNIKYFEIFNYPPIVCFENWEQKVNNLHQLCAAVPQTKILVYQGKLMQGRGLTAIIKLMDLINKEQTNSAKEKKNRYHLVILGDGENKSEFETLVLSLGLSKQVTFLGNLPYEKLMYYTHQAYLSFVLFEPISLSYTFALPNKLFEAAMAEIPVIHSDLPAISEVLQQFPFGEKVPKNFTEQDLLTALTTFEIEGNYFKKKAFAIKAKMHYNYSQQIPIIKEIFDIQSNEQ